MDHTHSHAHEHRRTVHHHAPPFSPLGTGLGWRLLIAVSASTLLWLTILWALN